MDVVCVQDEAGKFHYTEFYVKFKLPATDEASMALIGAADGCAEHGGDISMDDESIAALAKKDAELLTPPAEPAWIVVFVNGKQLDNVMAFVGLGQIMHFYDSKTRRCFITPSQEYFRRFDIKPGKNKFVCWHRGTDVSLVFNLWWYDVNDNLVVMDIDGTITRSDLRGYIQTVYLGVFTYIHEGLVEFLNALSTVHNFKLIYLTSRPMAHRKETINLLRGIKGSDGRSIPDGPLFTTKSRLMVALYKEVITRETAQLKSGMLHSVVQVFLRAGLTRLSPFVLGIGNKENDALAYNSVGLPGENILLINTTSRISVWKSNHYNHSNASSSSNSAASSRFSTPLKKTKSGNASFFAGLTDGAMKTIGSQKRQSMGDSQVMVESFGTLPAAADQTDSDAEKAPSGTDEDDAGGTEPSRTDSGRADSTGDDATHFKSYSDPGLLRYIDKVVRALILHF